MAIAMEEDIVGKFPSPQIVLIFGNYNLPTFSIRKYIFFKAKMEVTEQKTILVIDDDYYICDVLRTCLEIFGGCNTITTGHAEEGLAMVMEHRPDVIVLDMLMPNMDGFTFLQKLQADSKIADIPVVLLTSRVDLTEPQAITKLGVKGAISKPFHPVKLFAEISQILGWE